MLSIHLNQLKFQAHHGLYDEEKKLGNEFEINVTVKYHPHEIPLVEIKKTIDYTSIYNLLKERVQQPVQLLETFATETALEILRQFKLAEEVSISIKKSHPPVINFEGTVAVSFSITRSELVNK